MVYKEKQPTISIHLHTLNNLHEYEPINNSMSQLKQVHKGLSMNSFEQFYIQLHHYHNELIPEQSPGEGNPV
jgi:hypothetical protein